MARRGSRRRGISPADLPHLKTQVLASLDEAIAVETDTLSREKLTGHRAHMEAAELWWVAAPMAALAYQAQHTLPDDTSMADTRPSVAGIIIYSGGTGTSITWKDVPETQITIGAFGQKIYPQIDIIGLAWVADVLLGITDSPVVPASTPDDLAFLVGLDRHDEASLARLLVTSWLLAEQPTIGAARPYTPAGGKLGTPTPADIKIIKLRPSLTHPEPWDTTHKKEKTWTLKHRIMVGGHWKRQRYGPNLEQHKQIYIAPYLKGPSNAPLILKDPIKVWSR